MKRTILSLTAGLSLWLGVSSAANGQALFEFPVTNNEVVNGFGDSMWHDADNTSPQTGNMFFDYWASWAYLMHPAVSNLNFYNWANSGSQIDSQPNSQAAVVSDCGLVTFAFNAFNGVFGSTNIGISYMTSNGNQTTNGAFLSLSNLFQFPSWSTNGATANVQEPGWPQTNSVAWIAMGAVPGTNAAPITSDQSDWARNNAATNAGAKFGILGIDMFNALLPFWTNAVGAPFIFYPSSVGGKAGHGTAACDLSWAFEWLRLSTSDTNVASISLQWASGSGAILSTNHCFSSAPVLNGNTLTWTNTYDRLPMAWDYPGPDGLGNTITNDCSAAYTKINTNDANLFHFDLKITGLPAGNYVVKINNETVADNVSSATLSSGTGWNMFTNTTGPIWRQRASTLTQYRIGIEYADPVTLIRGSGGDLIGTAGLGSVLNAEFPTVHGQTLVTNVETHSGVSAFDLISGMNTNNTRSFKAVRNTTQSISYTFSVTIKNQINVGQLNVYAYLVPSGTVGKWNLKYGPGYDPSAFNWYAVVSPDLIHWTMWGSHTLEDSDELVYRPPKGNTLFAYAVGYPKPAAPALQP